MAMRKTERKRKMVAGLAMVVAVLAGRVASATTYDEYQLHGSSCVSITSGAVPGYSWYGVNAAAVPIDVTCPVLLPAFSYTYAYMLVEGYNRSSSDHLSCTFTGSDFDGTNPVSGVATLTANASSPQIAVATTNALFAPLFITCHLPAHTASGYSHLTSIFLEVGH
jgi:hypothetical protein